MRIGSQASLSQTPKVHCARNADSWQEKSQHAGDITVTVLLEGGPQKSCLGKQTEVHTDSVILHLGFGSLGEQKKIRIWTRGTNSPLKHLSNLLKFGVGNHIFTWIFKNLIMMQFTVKIGRILRWLPKYPHPLLYTNFLPEIPSNINLVLLWRYSKSPKSVDLKTGELSSVGLQWAWPNQLSP